MFNDWIHWLCSKEPDRLLWLLAPLLLVDTPRYALGSVLICLFDLVRDVRRLLFGRVPPGDRPYDHCPSVCVVIAGLNESATIVQTLDSLWGTYPNMEIVVVDDGSNDGMARLARDFAIEHSRVTVLRNPRRGGKSSAMNFALRFTQSEIIVCVDGDTQLSPNAIWEVVQPFRDPEVAAVSGAVLARHPFTNLATWLQAFEYLRGIFVGRMVLSRLGVLGIVSGALGAYRRSALLRMGGWDVGPGEDGDLTLRLRKAGYRIAYTPYAQCLTNLPRTWVRLLLQRRRWDWAAVTFECRKHVEMANPLCRHFRWSNFWVLADRWVLNVLLVYGLWAYAAWLVATWHAHTWKLLATYYVGYVLLDVAQLAVILYYSVDRRRDLLIGLAVPLMPLYHLLLRLVTLVAITEEIASRRSYRDRFVPVHVREATWHW